VVQRIEQQVRSRGVGVTDVAQEIFDNLSKTMPCEWSGKDIEVFEEVVIAEPYSVEECRFKAGSGNETIMDRVKMVLGEELKRLGADHASGIAQGKPNGEGGNTT
jgi:protein LSM12